MKPTRIFSTANLIPNPVALRARRMAGLMFTTETQQLGGMEFPLNPSAGGINNKRLRSRGGPDAAGFPEPTVVDQPINRDAN